MFERFTEDARQVVVQAQEEARRLHSRHIGTEHLLLGLLDQDSPTAGSRLPAADATSAVSAIPVNLSCQPARCQPALTAAFLPSQDAPD